MTESAVLSEIAGLRDGLVAIQGHINSVSASGDMLREDVHALRADIDRMQEKQMELETRIVALERKAP
jgi:hypothetical protein